MIDPSKALSRAGAMVSRRWLFFVGVLALFFALRLPFLRADPPPVMLHGFPTVELMVEPPAKSSEARNYALFGSFVPNEADNYRFWRSQSPFWVYPLAGAYRLFGVSYATLRLFALAWSFVGAIAAYFTARRAFAPAALVAFVCFAVVDHVDAIYGRAGLLEPAVAAMLMVGIASLVRANERVAWLVPALVAFFAAFFVKQAAIVAFPTLLVFGSIALVRARGVARPWLWRILVLVLAAALLGALLFMVTRVDYQRTVTWNYNHVLVGRGNNSQQIDADDLFENNVIVTFSTMLQRVRGLGGIFLVTLPLALWAVGTTLVLAVRERRLDLTRAVFASWFLTALVALFVTKPSGIRFLVLLAPPCAYLAAAKIDDLLRAPTRARSWVALVAVGAHLVFQGIGLGMIAANVSYDVVAAGRALERAIGPRDAVIIGQWAAPAVLETRYKQYYVKDVFNSDVDRLRELGVTHTLLRKGDFTRSFLARGAYPILDGKPAATIPFLWGTSLTLADVPPRWWLRTRPFTVRTR